LLRARDKLQKAGREAVKKEMIEKAAVDSAAAERVLLLAEAKGKNTELLHRLEGDFGKNDKAKEGIRRLRELVDVWRAAGMIEEHLVLDLSIARGLDYYTGTIYETFLSDLPQIGSVCSGGRYDNLAGLYTKQQLPGVGASLGVDRLLAAMEELNMVQSSSAPAPVLVVQFASSALGEYQRIARILRSAGLGVEVFPDDKKIGQQLQYAEKKGFRAALIAGPDELPKRMWKVTDLMKREEAAVREADVVTTIRNILSSG